jgi:hypothetical protein
MPSVYVHEIGHMLVCASNGSNFVLGVHAFGGTLHCASIPGDGLLFLSFGGIFAAIVLASPFVAWKKIIQRTYLSVPLVSLIAGHVVNSVLEGFFNIWYMTHFVLAIILVNAVIVAVFLSLLKIKK